ncbi:restriction endonuclease subunit S [Actinomadura mexicana]|uniref:Type I restriction enzyme, S subunit n=1 Tax=Actinomadura mexicana TaxID=134959 RepID=A0A238X304_9ACTN|nr:restriction endonuclease subunit S [Actinomadura mexicana]SNR52219.1 type I restriction enzyme, S subunit [Actinomadura mexicana]
MSDLPSGWTFRRLTELVDFPEGQVDPTRQPYADWTLVAPDHVESGYGRLVEKQSAAEQGAVSGKYVVKPGDVIYSKIRPALRKAVLVDFPGLCSADMYPLRVRKDLDTRFLLAILLGERFSRFAEAVSGRSGIPKVNRRELAEHKLPVPPLWEQRRIAEILEALDGEVKVTRQLASKARATRRALLEAELKIIENNAEDFPLRELSLEGGEYGSNSPSVPYTEGLPRYVRITDIDEYGRLRDDSIVGHPVVGSAPYMLRDGDLLIARTGFTTGKTLLFQQKYGRCVFAGYLVRFRLDPSLVDPRYVFLWTCGNAFSRWVNRTFREVGQRNISAMEYGVHRLPVPSLEVQRRLVDRIEALDGLTENYQGRWHRLLEVKNGLAEDLLTGRVRV